MVYCVGFLCNRHQGVQVDKYEFAVDIARAMTKRASIGVKALALDTPRLWWENVDYLSEAEREVDLLCDAQTLDT